VIAKPLSKTGRFLLDLLGVTKNTDNFFLGLNREITPIINIAPFIAAEALDEVIVTGVAAVLDVVIMYTNTTGRVQYVHGLTIYSDPLAAASSIEGRAVMSSFPANAPPSFFGQLGDADVAFTGELMQSGGLFFDSPVPLLPGWSLGCSVTTLTGVAPTLDLRALVSNSTS